jgi:hypothetical protein
MWDSRPRLSGRAKLDGFLIQAGKLRHYPILTFLNSHIVLCNT